MKFIKHFSQLSKKDVDIAGGKGSSLGEMTRLFARFAESRRESRQAQNNLVPPGFVVLADAFEKFLEETDIDVEIDAIIDKLNIKDMNSIEQAAEKIESLIMNADFPTDLAKEISAEFSKLDSEFVAVRSSATAEDSSTASWAGELESYLNTTEKSLLENIKKCWASLFSPRAIFYRFEKKLHKTKVSVAVVVQAMIQSEVSGITFTVHPVTKDYNQMVIEAGYGLGEAIVGGKITPDTYVIDKKDLKIIDKNISEQNMMIVRSENNNVEKPIDISKSDQQKLSNSDILKLAKICIDIEKHYGQPQDIEWAFTNSNLKSQTSKLYILQSRPITTL